jgi:hypothetical protein
MLVKEYSELVGVSTVSVTKRLKLNNPPRPVTSYRKFGNTYDMQVDTELLKAEIMAKKSKKIV